jgi:hypothetical protein
MNSQRLLLAVTLCLFAWSALQAEEPKPPDTKPAEEKKEEKRPKKQQVERLWPRGPEVAALKSAGLTDDQLAKIKDAVAVVVKKNTDLQAEKDVAAAEEEVKKAEAALKAAEEKAKAAKNNFDLNEELKKAVFENAPEGKKEAIADIIKFRPKKAENKPAKKEEKKEEVKAPAQ